MQIFGTAISGPKDLKTNLQDHYQRSQRFECKSLGLTRPEELPGTQKNGQKWPELAKNGKINGSDLKEPQICYRIHCLTWKSGQVG